VKLDKRGRLRAAGPVLVPIRTAAHSAAAKVARVSVSTPTASSAGSPRPTARAAAPASYVVRAGDTLYGIAQRFNVAVDALRQVNRLAANAVIKPGLRLQLP
jgi:LysM repeat protein